MPGLGGFMSVRVIWHFKTLQPGGLAEPYELVVDEAILDVVELVNVLHNCLTLCLALPVVCGVRPDRWLVWANLW